MSSSGSSSTALGVGVCSRSAATWLLGAASSAALERATDVITNRLDARRPRRTRSTLYVRVRGEEKIFRPRCSNSPRRAQNEQNACRDSPRRRFPPTRVLRSRGGHFWPPFGTAATVDFF